MCALKHRECFKKSSMRTATASFTHVRDTLRQPLWGFLQFPRPRPPTKVTGISKTAPSEGSRLLLTTLNRLSGVCLAYRRKNVGTRVENVSLWVWNREKECEKRDFIKLKNRQELNSKVSCFGAQEGPIELISNNSSSRKPGNNNHNQASSPIWTLWCA
jgi:hypothetical protein